MSDALGYPHFAAHSIAEFPAELPQDCVLSIHALNGKTEKDFFEKHSCRVIVLARHPLDIFVSVLQFARNEPLHEWLDGACEIPKNAQELTPDDAAFVQWMIGPGARMLLSVSLRWWQDPDSVIRLKYEDCISDVAGQLSNVFERLNISPVRSLEDVAKSYPVSYFAKFSNHGWLGAKESYLRFITRANCEVVYRAQADYFTTLGYVLGDNSALTHAMAKKDYLDSLPALLKRTPLTKQFSRRLKSAVSALFPPG